MNYKRMPIEMESPEQLGYDTIKHNLAESSVSDQILKNITLNINDLVLCYTDHYGKPELRELIINEHNNLHKDNVLLTVGAASALFIISTTLLSKDDHLIVVRPNYATNIETPRAIGCHISFIDLTIDNNWKINRAEIIKAIKPNTKYISVTNPHNPTGVVLAQHEIDALIQIAEEHNVYLLVDETYRDLNFTVKQPLAATLSNKVISVSSVSKAFGLPGIRLGWLITQDAQLMEKFLAAKEQIFICNSALDEEVAYQFMVEKNKYYAPIQQRYMHNFEVLKTWLITEQHRIKCVVPQGGTVCFPCITAHIDIVKFYDILVNKYATMVGAGHWFEMPDTYMRIGFGWPTETEFEQGLNNITLALNECTHS
jgi:aspartate/methionine/tyrosine aminotransferase